MVKTAKEWPQTISRTLVGVYAFLSQVRLASGYAALIAVLLIVSASPLQAQPQITALSPPGAALGSEGFTLTVHGSNFSPGANVWWNGAVRTTTRISSFELRATIPASDLLTTTHASVFVLSGVMSNTALFTIYRDFSLDAKSLVYDGTSRRIYASLGGSGPSGNSITWIDPFTGSQGSPVWVGSEPGKLAISDNGQFLYVGLDGARSIRRFDLASQTPGLQFPLGADSFFGPYIAEDIEVLPGSPSSIAVSRRTMNGPLGDLVVYDDAVARPTQVNWQTASAHIEFSAAASTLYGCCNQGFQRMDVNAQGVSIANTANNLPLGSDFEFHNGFVYTTYGSVIDPVNLISLGIFTAPDLTGVSVAADSAMDRMFFLTHSGSAAIIHAFNRTNFGLVGTLSIPVSGDFISDLLRWGDDGLAFRTRGNQVFVFRIPPAWYSSGPPITLSPAAFGFATQAVNTISLSKSSILKNNTNSPIAINSISATGDFSQTNNCGSSVAANASCSINVFFTPTVLGMRTGTVTIVNGSSASPHVISVFGIGGSSFPVPSITSVSPDSVAAGSAGFTLTVTGAKFVSQSVVRWNGVSKPTTFVNSGVLSATISASDVAGMQSAEVTVFNPSPDGGLSNVAVLSVFGSVPVTLNNLLYDRFSRRIYASIPGSFPNGNSIVTIDPFTASLGASTWVGSEPGRLALSDNGQYLYVVLSGAAAVRRVALPSLTAGLQFPVGFNPFSGPLYPNDLQVLPGNPASLALTYGENVAVFDDGVKRPVEVNNFPAASAIAFSNSASTLYGAIDSKFQTLAVDSNGVIKTNTVALPVLGAAGTLKFDDGRIYSSNGSVVDPATSTMAGTLGASGSMVAESAQDRVFVLTGDSSAAIIYAFNRTNFTLIGSMTLSGLGNPAYNMVRWGDDGLAFYAANSRQVVLIRIPRAWLTSVPAITVNPASLVFATQAVSTTSSPRAVTLTNNTASPIAVTSIIAAGDFAQTNDCGSSIAAFESCTISVTFTPLSAGIRAGSLTITDGSAGSPHVIDLSGIGNTTVPLPAVTSLYPFSAPMGSAGFSLTVTGVNFVPQSVVRWNGADLATTFNDSSTLTVTIPASRLMGLDSATVTVFNPPPDGGASNGAIFTVHRKLMLATNDLVYDKVTRRIYASVPGLAPNGNTITSIDPASGLLGTPVFIGSEPTKLAISDNSQFLYVGLDGSAAVRRFDLSTQTPGLEFSLGNHPSVGPLAAADIEVLPGNPSAVAVAYSGAVAVFDNGVKRPIETAIFGGNDLITVSESASKLYGTDSQSFRTLTVNSGGVTQTDNATQLISGFQVDMQFEGGRVYVSTGTIVEPADRRLAGKLIVSDAFSSSPPGFVVSDPDLNLVFLLGYYRNDSRNAIIQAFDRTNQTLVGTLITGPFNGDKLGRLVRWGTDGLAFRTTGSEVFILRIPRSWYTSGPTLNVSPGSISFPAQPVSTTSAAYSVTLSNNSGSAISITNISTTGDFGQTNGCGSSIAAFSACTINVTFTPTAQGIRMGTLTIAHGAEGSPLIVAFSGIGDTSFPVPLITGTTPVGVPVGSGSFVLTVTGTNFVNGSVVRWNGQDRPTSFVSSTQLTATISAGDLAALNTALITVFNPAPDGGISNVVAFTIYRVIQLSSRDLVYDRFSQRIYASIPTSAPNGSSVIPIDPVTGTTGNPVPIGFDPDKLALSDDGQYLYVSQVWGGNVRRVHVPSQTAGIQFSFGANQNSGTRQMQVLPGNPAALAVAREENVAIYDDGVARPTDTGNLRSPSIAFSSSASTLYGMGEFFMPGFRTMSVTSQGVTVTNTTPNLLIGAIRYDNGRIYGTSGAVLNPSNRLLIGKFSATQFTVSVVPESSISRVFFLNGGQVAAFNLNNFTLVGTLAVPITEQIVSVSSLIRWETDGLAFRTTTDKVFLMRIPASWMGSPPPLRRPGQITSQ